METCGMVPPSAHPVARPPRVLIVEDAEPDRRWLERLVAAEAPDADVAVAPDARQALQAIAGAGFDLAILDLELHGDRSAGERLVGALRLRGRTPVVVVSGLDVRAWRPLMFSLDVWDYFEKPADEASVRCVVRRILDARAGAAVESVVQLGSLRWRPARLENPVWRGVPVPLSLGEQRILLALVSAPDRLVPRSQLYDCFERWDRDPERLRASLGTAIYEIRRAFRAVDPDFDRIMAVGSAGYLWQSD
jgi:DNA-binding response OmpR family regulator